MNVLSCFDGIACGYEALKRIGREPEYYFASEVDPCAIRVANTRHPKIIQIGDIQTLKNSDLPKIDLIIGGSPCQGFSKLGKQQGLNHDGSKLFFQFARLLRELQEDKSDILFLLENVEMSKGDNSIITDWLGVTPIKINSNLVSAQNRDRLYWTNIPGVTQPKDRRIFYPNIAEYGIPRLLKKIVDPSKIYNLSDFAKAELPRPINFSIRRTAEGRRIRSEGFKNKQGDLTCWKHREYFPRVDLKVSSILTDFDKQHTILDEDGDFRRLTITECERLQTLPDGYTDIGIKESKRLGMIGNGWTVDVIAHILNFIP